MSRQAHGAATLAAGILASRILGFARDMLLAHLLGSGADPFLVAFRVPNFFRRLLAEGSLGMAHGAAVSRRLLTRGSAAALKLSRSVCLRLFLLSLPFTALLALFSPSLTFLLAPGLASPALEKSALLLRLCLPYLPLCAVSAIAFAHASASGNFRPQAWSPLLLNCLSLFAGGVALLPTTEAPNAPVFFGPQASGAELLLCLGIVCGGLAQAGLGLRVLGRSELPEATSTETRPVAGGISDREVGALLRSLPASALGAAPQQIHLLAGTVLASFLAPGGISALYFAERLFELPLGLAGVAVGLSSLHHLSTQAAGNDMRGFCGTLSGSLRLSAFFCFPAAAGLYVLALPLADLLFGYGSFSPEQVICTASALRVYALGLPAMCAARPLLAAAHALGLERVPLRTACLSLGILVPVSLTGMFLAGRTPSGAVAGLAFGLTAGAWVNTFLLMRRLRAHGVSCPLRRAARPLALYAVGALLMAGALSVIMEYFRPLSAGALLLLVGLCLGGWTGISYVLNNADVRSLPGILRSRSKDPGKKEGKF